MGTRREEESELAQRQRATQTPSAEISGRYTFPT